MRRSDLFMGLLFLALSSIYLAGALGLPQGTRGGVPRAGTFPLIIGILFLGSSLVYCGRWTYLFAKGKAVGQGEPLRLDVQVLALAIGLFVYLYLMSAVGFLISTVVFSFSTLSFLFGRRRTWSAVIALCITGASYAIFEWGLRVRLPSGTWFG